LLLFSLLLFAVRPLLLPCLLLMLLMHWQSVWVPCGRLWVCCWPELAAH
jgi:hypothetical protein